MFTGIIERSARIKKVEKVGENLRLHIDLKGLAQDLRVGESVAVDGACLTVIGLSNSTASFDAMKETLGRTTLCTLKAGSEVNIERSVRLADRLNGHIVTGHVDGTGKIVKRVDREGYSKIWVSAPKEILRMVIPKGSVALDGTSMTVVDVKRDSFSVCIIPHTMMVTNLGERRVGDAVNIEADMIGKWVKKLLEGMKAP